MILRLTSEQIDRAADVRRPGFAAAIKAAAARDGEIYHVDSADWHRLAAEFFAEPSPPRPGLGDLVAAVATPIARALRLPCIDPATKQLRPDSGCAQRKAALNKLWNTESTEEAQRPRR